MGLNEPGKMSSPVLFLMRTSLALFQRSGNTPFLKRSEKQRASPPLQMSAALFTTSPGTPSGPGALPRPILAAALRTSSGSTSTPARSRRSSFGDTGIFLDGSEEVPPGRSLGPPDSTDQTPLGLPPAVKALPYPGQVAAASSPLISASSREHCLPPKGCNLPRPPWHHTPPVHSCSDPRHTNVTCPG
ncbi:verprolin-like [Polistes fuscatus]|uniref:verprolin-like n=1 Tax=Polistes fuscatus TaxID=30207 RepID=UPI001CAA14DD|nr:verprolin-like [Polistes fuscatus]